MPKALDPVSKRIALHKLAAGETQMDAAAAVGVNQGTISRLKSKAESKAIIEAESQKLLAALPDIVEVYREGIETNKKLSAYLAGKDNHQANIIVDRLTQSSMDGNGDAVLPIVKLHDQLSKRHDRYLQAVGILPSQSPSIFIQSLNDNRSVQVFGEGVMQMLGQFGQSLVASKEELDPQDVVVEGATEDGNR